MLRYENLGVVGEGSYGMVLKCRHKESRQIVAVKKFIESEDDEMVKKIAMREIRMLKMLRHENLVNLLEVFRRKKRVYLVFEFVDKTVLDDLERHPEGLNVIDVKRISFQVLRGLEFCHSHNVMHRDVKPENILVSNSGIVKLCDFGFARTLVVGPGEAFTDYVATRWYRSPELLVGDLSYGKAVDIWAIGCLLFEMFTGDPLFPGDSDIDQLFHVTKRLGNLTPRHQDIFQQNPLFIGLRLPNVKQPDPFWGKFPQLTSSVIDLIKKALSLEATKRPSCLEMMKHEFFQGDNFATDFLEVLKTLIGKATVSNPLLKSLASQKESQIHQNSDKDKSKSRKKKDCRDLIKKNVSEIKQKKDLKYIPKQISQPMLYSSSSNINDGKLDNSLSKKSTTDIKKLEKMNKFSVNDSEVPCKENSSYRFKDVSASCELEPLNKRSESDRSDTKLSLRTPLEVSINMLGKNLPELNCSISGPARSHGFDTKKVKNFYSSSNSNSLNNNNTSKKSISSHKSSTLCLLSEKANLHTTRGEGDTTKTPSLTLPSVIGADVRSPPGVSSREASREPHVTSIPHIQNIDPFSSTSLCTRESPTVNETADGFERTLKSGNLPAV